MSNTATASVRGRFIEVTFAGSGADWDSMADTNMPAELRNLGQLKVSSITFIPSAANDKCVITETSGGPKLFEAISIQTTTGVVNDVTKSFGDGGTWMRPFFYLAGSTLGTAANAKILVELS